MHLSISPENSIFTNNPCSWIDRISPEMKEKIGNLSFQNYRPTKKNILVIGPVPGKKYSEITFPILSPDPASNKDAHFLKYPIYVGGNRGRGQIYPDGNKSNNTVYNATATGIVSKIIRKEKGGYEITITDALDGHQVVDIIPPGPELLVSEGESIKLDRSMSLPFSASFTKIVISLLPILAKPPIRAIVNHWSLRRILKIPISTAVAIGA